MSCLPYTIPPALPYLPCPTYPILPVLSCLSYPPTLYCLPYPACFVLPAFWSLHLSCSHPANLDEWQQGKGKVQCMYGHKVSVNFTTWWDSPAKRCQIIFFKMFVKKVFNWFSRFLRICIQVVPKNIHIWTQRPPKNVILFFTYVYQKYSYFYADFKSVDIFGKKFIQKKLFANFFLRV